MIELNHLLSDKDSYPFLSSEILGTTMSGLRIDDQESLAISQPNGVARPVILVLVPEMNRHDIKYVGIMPRSICLWSSELGSEASKTWACKYVISGEAEDESLDSSDLAAVSMSSPPYAIAHPMPGFSRGIFSISRHRSLLYSENVEVVIPKLRQWRPSIQINPSRLQSEDE